MAWRTQRPTRPTWRGIAAAVVLCGAALYVWFGSPSWADPPPVPALPSAQETAGLHLAVALQVQRVLDFRRAQGRLPDVLRETGEPVPGIAYERIDARTFTVTGLGAQGPVRYLSGDSIATLVEPARPLLGGER